MEAANTLCIYPNPLFQEQSSSNNIASYKTADMAMEIFGNYYQILKDQVKCEKKVFANTSMNLLLCYGSIHACFPLTFLSPALSLGAIAVATAKTASQAYKWFNFDIASTHKKEHIIKMCEALTVFAKAFENVTQPSQEKPSHEEIRILFEKFDVLMQPKNAEYLPNKDLTLFSLTGKVSLMNAVMQTLRIKDKKSDLAANWRVMINDFSNHSDITEPWKSFGIINPGRDAHIDFVLQQENGSLKIKERMIAIFKSIVQEEASGILVIKNP